MSTPPRGPVGIHVERGNQQRRIKVVGADGEVKAEVPHYAVVQALVEREGIATSLTPDALVEEELRAITVCEGCREKPLGMAPEAINRRRHVARPWLCNGCAAAARNMLKVPDEVLTTQVCEVCRERPLSMSRSAVLKRRSKRRPWPCKHCAGHLSQANKTTEQRILQGRKAALTRPKGQQSEVARRYYASMTPEQRSERQRKAASSVTGERLREAVRKRLETIRAKQAAANESTKEPTDE